MDHAGEPAPGRTPEPAPRLVVRPTATDGTPLAEPFAVSVPIGRSIELGRDADFAIGLDPEDGGISRTALRIRPAADGWDLSVPNRNGAVVHPWAQQPVWLSAGMTYTLAWPRVGVRLAGADPDALLHWVLLEYDGFTNQVLNRASSGNTVTMYAERPDALTQAQLDAVQELFAEHLAWPPKLGPASDNVKRVARRLGIGQTAVMLRLQGARHKAYQLGSHPQAGVTEPDYLYALAKNGYLPWPTARCEAAGVDMDTVNLT